MELALVLLRICRQLYCNELHAGCQAALAQRHELQPRLTKLAADALQRLSIALRLPAERRPEWATWEAALQATQLLTSNGLRPALESLLHHDGLDPSGGKRSLLHTAAQLVALAPAECPPAMPRYVLVCLHIALADTLSCVAAAHASAACSLPPAAASSVEQPVSTGHPAAVQRRLASELLPVLPRMAASLQLLLESGGANSSAVSGSCTALDSSSSDDTCGVDSLLQSGSDLAQLAAQLCSAWVPFMWVVGELGAPNSPQ